MIIYTDSTDYAERLFEINGPWKEFDEPHPDPALAALMSNLYEKTTIYNYNNELYNDWPVAFVVDEAPRSQYDLLIELARQGVRLPNGVLCLAGSGREFHGQRGRPWKTLLGNIHLSVSLAPQRPIEHFHTGFSILAAVALVEAIDRFDPVCGAVKIKWVNDLLLEGAKVAGFLAHTSSVDGRISNAVLGIGLNVEATPELSADPCVPRAISLGEIMPDRTLCNLRSALGFVLEALAAGYARLLSGGYKHLFNQYVMRSAVMGSVVRVVDDALEGAGDEIAAGRVVRIGDNLELYLEGRSDPILTGRLILEEERG